MHSELWFSLVWEGLQAICKEFYASKLKYQEQLNEFIKNVTVNKYLNLYHT